MVIGAMLHIASRRTHPSNERRRQCAASAQTNIRTRPAWLIAQALRDLPAWLREPVHRLANLSGPAWLVGAQAVDPSFCCKAFCGVRES
jgi:hypothetical protein